MHPHAMSMVARQRTHDLLASAADERMGMEAALAGRSTVGRPTVGTATAVGRWACRWVRSVRLEAFTLRRVVASSAERSAF